MKRLGRGNVGQVVHRSSAAGGGAIFLYKMQHRRVTTYLGETDMTVSPTDLASIDLGALRGEAQALSCGFHVVQ